MVAVGQLGILNRSLCELISPVIYMWLTGKLMRSGCPNTNESEEFLVEQAVKYVWNQICMRHA